MAEVATLRQALKMKQEENIRLKALLGDPQLTIDRIDGRIDTEEEKSQTLQTMYDGLKREHEDLKRDHEDLKREHQQLRIEFDLVTKDYEQLRMQLQALGKAHNELKAEVIVTELAKKSTDAEARIHAHDLATMYIITWNPN